MVISIKKNNRKNTFIRDSGIEMFTLHSKRGSKLGHYTLCTYYMYHKFIYIYIHTSQIEFIYFHGILIIWFMDSWYLPNNSDVHLYKCSMMTRAAYRYTIRSGIDITRYRSRVSKWHTQKRYSKSILTSGIWEKSNNNLIKYHPANHNIPVYSNKMKKFDMWILPWQALWQLPLHIITAQAVAVGCVWCSWWQFSTFHCRIASLWIIWLCGYRDMDRIDIGIEMWYQYWYRYRKICNDMQP